MPNVTFIASRRKGPLRNFVPTAHLRCIAVCRIQTGHRWPDDGVGCSVLFTEQTPRPSRQFYESGNLRISHAQCSKHLPCRHRSFRRSLGRLVAFSFRTCIGGHLRTASHAVDRGWR